MRLACDANKPMKLLKIFRRRGAWPEQLTLRIEVEHESDGRWIVDVVDLPGVISSGATKDEARDNAAMLALRIIDERRQHGEDLPDFDIPESVQPADHIPRA